jgi:hypothetical protein
MTNQTIKKVISLSLAASLALAPAVTLAQNNNGKGKGPKAEVRSEVSVNANANSLKANAQVNSTTTATTTPKGKSCLKAIGHLIAPGWIKNNGSIATTSLDANCKLPFGIGKKLDGLVTHPGNGGDDDDDDNATTTPDTTPNAFHFNDQTNVALSTLISSNVITVSGINASTSISVSGGEYSVNGGAYASTTGTVQNGDTVQVRHTSSSSFNTSVNTTLTIGGVSDTFTTTTVNAGDETAPAIFLVMSNAATSSATITWFTTEPATSQVAYGTTTAYGATSTLNSSLTFFHSVTLTGLAASTTYHFQVMSSDASGNDAVSADMTLTTDANPDTTAPVISNISVGSVGSTTATVSWNTDEAANSKVFYAAGGSLDLNTASSSSNSALVTSHSVALAGLSASTTYSFAVQSADASGNVSTSATSSFVTGI